DVRIDTAYIGLNSSTAPAPGNIRLDRALYTVSEGAAQLSIRVKRKGGSSGAVSAQYSVTDVTTQSGADYLAVSGTLNWAAGDTADKVITITPVNDTVVESTESFTLALSNPTGGAELGNITSASVYILDNDTPFVMAPNPIISRGRPAYASSDASNAYLVTNGSYTDSSSGRWLPSSVPAWIAVNVGSGYSRVLLSWNNGTVLNYADTASYAGPRDYTILTSADSTNGSDGTWQTAATVTGNIYRTREHSFDFTGKSWVKMNISSATGTLGIDEIDIHDASNGCNDTVIFFGDSIAQRAFRRTNARRPSYSDVIHSNHPQYYPAMISGGYGGTTTGEWNRNLFQGALDANPDIKFWCIELGYNDFTWECHASTAFFRKNLQSLFDRIKIAGRVPMVRRIPWGTSNTIGYVPIWNQVIDEMVVENGLLTGPDMYAAFLGHTEYLEDAVHPNAAGSIVINQEWADSMDSLYTVVIDTSDTTPPAAPAVVRDGTGSDESATTSTTQLSANWDSGADAQSGISKYWYAIGTQQSGAGASNTKAWTD
ncbi:MAG: hypothetical protein A2297_03650, partial [Elusimicrobia bacterium RIFOXYB2_FULL_48_7]